MNIDALLIVNAALLLAALAGLILVLRRQSGGGLEAALRQELERSRAESREGAQALRTEVVATMSAMGQAQGQGLTDFAQRLDQFNRQTQDQFADLRGEVALALKDSGGLITGTLDRLGQAQQERLEKVAQETAALSQGNQQAARAAREELSRTLASLSEAQKERLEAVRVDLDRIAATVGQSLEQMRDTVESRLREMQASNEARLEQMRATVDEKLQSTLEARLGESFRQVSEHLEKVHRSVGEMQDLAKGVGDLKRVLGEVKSRGIWGEVQLGALLEQVLAPEQYQRDLEIPPGSGQKVEFAIRLPGADDGEVWLPIDAKFPLLDYERLVAASEQADKAGVEEAARKIERFIKDKAKEISKYVAPPLTTNFAVMFLPVEGLYAEVLRRQDLATELQVKHRVMVAGPTTLYALLNSLQMGFRTLAIQKRSSEVWQILGAIKTEFAKYGEVIEKVRHKLQEADKHLDKVSVRRRAIDRRLKDVESLPEPQAVGLLGLDDLATEAEPTGEEE